MRRPVWMLLWAVVGCGPPVPKEVLVGVSDDLAAVGHPFGRFERVEVLSWRRGRPEAGDRYADVAVQYVRGGRPANTMVVRVYQQSVRPCQIGIDVLSDDGPNPFLLDNRVASDAVGRRLCRELETR